MSLKNRYTYLTNRNFFFSKQIKKSLFFQKYGEIYSVSPNGGQRVIKIKKIVTGSMVNRVQHMTYMNLFTILYLDKSGTAISI